VIQQESLQVLEFDKILAAIAGFTNSTASRQQVLTIRPLLDKSTIERRFGQVEEIRCLTRLGVPLPLAAFDDITASLELVRLAGSILAPLELRVFIPPLRIMAAIAAQFAYRTDIPLLKELAGHVTGFPHILEPLEHSIDPEGNLLDTASKLLFDLRSRKRSLTARIRRRLEEIVRERPTAIFLQDDFITQRSGRWVIPVRMDSKGMVPGVVHDVSNSGETAFMEPLEIIGLANELENLAADEKAEQIRILRELCSWIREEVVELGAQFRAIIQLDLLNSIARCSDLLRAETPQIFETPRLRLKQARHPILLLMQQAQGGREVVPLDLELGDASGDPNRIIVITGPNTGGKTIAIKTAGLLLTMALAGIPVPAAATSGFPLIHNLLVDIGDEQSIEASLSTFSAHVAKIANILEQADARTLVLMDELGTGTEPGQGAAIPCAVLSDLKEKGALVVATTHLTDIVGFVHRTAGMVNAAMEFDRHTLTPLYRLKSGEPGQSHAIEIARRYGLPERVIEAARGMLGRLEGEFHALLTELKEKGQRLDDTLADLVRREDALRQRENTLAERLAAAERQRQESQEKAYREAKEIIQAARREVGVILDEARREKSREAKQKLAEAEQQVEKRLAEFHPEERLNLEQIAEGAVLFVKPLGCDAVVTAVDLRQGRLRVRAGNIELDVAATDLAPRRGKNAPPRTHSRRAPVEAEKEPSCELNLIGMRVDDALTELEPFLNHASLARIGEVRIIHGKGTGVLMKAVRQYLDGHPLVASFRGGEPFEGGAGATVATLR
jgi:DNA mismatch repair protein MutS2